MSLHLFNSKGVNSRECKLAERLWLSPPTLAASFPTNQPWSSRSSLWTIWPSPDDGRPRSNPSSYRHRPPERWCPSPPCTDLRQESSMNRWFRVTPQQVTSTHIRHQWWLHSMTPFIYHFLYTSIYKGRHFFPAMFVWQLTLLSFKLLTHVCIGINNRVWIKDAALSYGVLSQITCCCK